MLSEATDLEGGLYFCRPPAVLHCTQQSASDSEHSAYATRLFIFAGSALPSYAEAERISKLMIRLACCRTPALALRGVLMWKFVSGRASFSVLVEFWE